MLLLLFEFDAVEGLFLFGFVFVCVDFGNVSFYVLSYVFLMVVFCVLYGCFNVNYEFSFVLCCVCVVLYVVF